MAEGIRELNDKFYDVNYIYYTEMCVWHIHISVFKRALFLMNF